MWHTAQFLSLAEKMGPLICKGKDRMVRDCICMMGARDCICMMGAYKPYKPFCCLDSSDTLTPLLPPVCTNLIGKQWAK